MTGISSSLQILLLFFSESLFLSRFRASARLPLRFSSLSPLFPLISDLQGPFLHPLIFRLPLRESQCVEEWMCTRDTPSQLFSVLFIRVHFTCNHTTIFGEYVCLPIPSRPRSVNITSPPSVSRILKPLYFQPYMIALFLFLFFLCGQNES